MNIRDLVESWVSLEVGPTVKFAQGHALVILPVVFISTGDRSSIYITDEKEGFVVSDRHLLRPKSDPNASFLTAWNDRVWLQHVTDHEREAITGIYEWACTRVEAARIEHRRRDQQRRDAISTALLNWKPPK